MLREPGLTENDIPPLIGGLCRLVDWDAPGTVDRLVSRHRAAVAQFEERGYAVWPMFPAHPFAPGLDEYRQWVTGQRNDLTSSVLALTHHAYAVEAFRDDWLGHEEWLAPRLQSDRGAMQTVSELGAGLHLRVLGCDVEYVAAKREGEPGADFVVHASEDVDVECVSVGADTGHSMPSRSGTVIASEVLAHLERRGLYRVVYVTLPGVFRPALTHPLIRDLRTAIDSGVLGTIELETASARVEILSGGTVEGPLDGAEIERRVDRLERVPLRWAITTEAATRVGGHRLVVAGHFLIRGVSFNSQVPDAAIKPLVQSALDKADQLNGRRPGLVIATFGRAVDEAQSRSRALVEALGSLTLERLRRRPTISAVLYMFVIGWRLGRAQTVQGTTAEARVTSLVIPNDAPAARKLPPDLWALFPSGVR